MNTEYIDISNFYVVYITHSDITTLLYLLYFNGVNVTLELKARSHLSFEKNRVVLNGNTII